MLPDFGDRAAGHLGAGRVHPRWPAGRSSADRPLAGGLAAAGGGARVRSRDRLRPDPPTPAGTRPSRLALRRRLGGPGRPSGHGERRPGRTRRRPRHAASTRSPGLWIRPARRAVLGRRVQRVMHDRFHNIVAEHNRAATPRPDAPHRSGSLRGEPATPPTDRLRRGRAPTSDLGVRNTVRGPQQRLGLAHLPSRRGVRTSKPLQLSPLPARHLQGPSRSHHPTHTKTDHYLSDTSPVHPIGGTLAKCDPFGTPSTSHWTGAAIIVQSPRTKTCIVTRSRTSTRPMPFSLAG